MIMHYVLAYLPLRDDCIEARLVHRQLVAGLAANDPLWVGDNFSRVKDALGALARALLVHKEMTGEDGLDDAAGGAATMGAASALATAGDAEDDDDDDEEDDEGVFDDASITTLRAILSSLRVSPAAAQVAALVGTLQKSEQVILSNFGLQFTA